MIPTMIMSCSFPPWFALISRPRPEKGGGQDQALGRSRGGLTTKIHMLTDGQGRPLQIILTPGQRGDVTQAPALLEGVQTRHILADKAHDSNVLRTIIAEMNAKAVIPCNPTRRKNIPYDFEIYKTRNLIERCFNTPLVDCSNRLPGNDIKHFRRIATRYDRRARYFLSFIQLASAMIWMR